ncbi:MAG: GNAT family N-acetyltransferase [Armatimonadetes bacterium]|nr:GNAT family N-acetyltransferase [Armatimonadota bacterium]
MVSVRQAVLDDAPALADAFVQSVSESYSPIIAPEDMHLFSYESALESIVGRISAGECVLAGEWDGRVVAYGRWCVMPEEPWPYPAMVYSLFVTPAHQSRGVGKMLILRCAELSVENGHKGMMIGSLRDNTRALGMYEGLGAKRVNEDPFQIGDRSYAHVLLAWDDLPSLIMRLA